MDEKTLKEWWAKAEAEDHEWMQKHGVESPFCRPEVEESIARLNREHPLTDADLYRLGWRRPSQKAAEKPK